MNAPLSRSGVSGIGSRTPTTANQRFAIHTIGDCCTSTMPRRAAVSAPSTTAGYCDDARFR
jgi:hypothetical protein